LTEVIKIFRIDSAQAYSAPAALAVVKPTNSFKPVAHKPASLKPAAAKPVAAKPAAATMVEAPASAKRPAPSAAKPAVAAGAEGDWESF
ncbi:MAG: hypothetical protein C0449_14995, partial [Polaromonas sp.]|nr:hypothetical protein [Polaromonas sp.]